jgi:trehalose 6-phosphate phosphatase
MTMRAPFIPETNIALFLDVDGTLLELAPTPDEVRVPASLRNTLKLTSENLSGAMALISGRSIKVLDRLFAPLVLPAAGHHGLERRTYDGRILSPEIDRNLLASPRQQLRELEFANPGLLLEDKGNALAFHYRRAPAFEKTIHDKVYELVKPISDKFIVRPGKFVFEIAPRGASKRIAIESFMQEAPFRGRVPVFLGDDVTDEDGFAAVNEMNGISVHVGTTHNSVARHQLASVTSVISWLRERNLSLRKA